jgi:hypothetical protein
MSVAPLVEELVGKGVRLSIEGGDLKCRGPKSALTPEVVARLKAHKAEVMAHLLTAPVKPPPSKVAPEAVERILENPPHWLAGSYLPAYRRGRCSLAGLACAVTAALKLSPYDDDVVDEVAEIMRGLGYRDSCAPPPPARALTELGEANAEDTAWR